MSEIRDEVLEDLLSIKGMHLDMLKAVITHPNIAIVDRVAELPRLKALTGEASIEEKAAFLLGVEACKEETLKAGWLKEVRDELSSK